MYNKISTNFHGIYQNKPSNINKEGQPVTDKENPFISDLFKRLENADNSRKVFEALESVAEKTPEFEQFSQNTYKYKDYFVVIGKEVFGKKLLSSLKKTEELSLSSAPQIAAVKKTGDDMLVIALKLKDTDLKPYKSSEVSLDSKAKFTREMQKLAGAGFVNNAVDNNENLLVNGKGEIIISDWNNLSSFDGDISAFNKKMRDICGTIY